MFLLALIIGILMGYLFKGSLKNIDVDRINGLYYVIGAFLLEFIMIKLLKIGKINIGTLTLVLDITMYSMLIIFIYLNRRNKWILLTGIGVILNAVVIFSNGGTMPVAMGAVRALGYNGSVNSQGLYSELYSGTRFAFLADIFAMKYPKPGVASIGDVIECIGMALYIIAEMKSKKFNKVEIKIEQ